MLLNLSLASSAFFPGAQAIFYRMPGGPAAAVIESAYFTGHQIALAQQSTQHFSWQFYLNGIFVVHSVHVSGC